MREASELRRLVCREREGPNSDRVGEEEEVAHTVTEEEARASVYMSIFQNERSRENTLRRDSLMNEGSKLNHFELHI